MSVLKLTKDQVQRLRSTVVFREFSHNKWDITAVLDYQEDLKGVVITQYLAKTYDGEKHPRDMSTAELVDHLKGECELRLYIDGRYEARSQVRVSV